MPPLPHTAALTSALRLLTSCTLVPLPLPLPLPRSNIACNCEETQKQIVAEGAVPILCDLLLPSCACGAACREAAAWTLSNLACSAEVRAQLG